MSKTVYKGEFDRVEDVDFEPTEGNAILVDRTIYIYRDHAWMPERRNNGLDRALDGLGNIVGKKNKGKSSIAHGYIAKIVQSVLFILVGFFVLYAVTTFTGHEMKNMDFVTKFVEGVMSIISGAMHL